MNILIISRYPPFPGGRENFVLELVNELSRNNKVLVLTPDRINSQSGNLVIKKYPKTKKELHNIIRQFNPSVINSHTFYLSLDAVSISKKEGIPFGITLHGDQFAIGNKQRQKIVAKVVEESDFVINVSNNGKKSILKNINNIEKKKIFVIKNGVNLKKFKACTTREKNESLKKINVGQNKTIILTTTRIAPYKGLHFLINTVIKNKIFLENNNILFLISIPDYIFSDNENKLFNILKKKISTNNIDSLIKFIFLKYEKIRTAYCSSDLFLLPSQKEQMPISILEAMASRIPVIATKVGGIPELLKNNIDAILVDFDNPTSLINAIKKNIKNSDNKMVKNSYTKVSDSFSIGTVADKYLVIYKKYAENTNYKYN